MITNIEPITDQGPLLTTEEIDDKIDRYTMELNITTDLHDRRQIFALINQYKELRKRLAAGKVNKLGSVK